MSRRADPDKTFEPIKRGHKYGNGSPRAVNKGKLKRGLKPERRLGDTKRKAKGHRKR